MGTTDPNKKEHLGRTLMRLSLVLSCGQVLLLFTILGPAFFTPTTFATPDYLKAAYVLGEAACVFVAIPSAIASLAISTEGKARAALVLAIGVAILCGFFMVFPG